MEKKIKITYTTYNDTGRDNYVSTRMVSLEESLRTVALSVINESIGKTNHNWLEEACDDQPIVFYLEGSKDPLQGFGIDYAINKDGSIQFLNGLAPTQHNWTLTEIYELRDNGYIEGDKSGIAIATPEGLGGSYEVAQIMDTIIFIGGAYGGIAAITSAMGIIRAKYSTLIKRWTYMDLRSLYQIRQLLDKKSVWSTDEVKKRLSVNEEFAIKILTKLGYEMSGDRWHLGQSQKSLAIRSKWLAKEKEIEKKQ